MPCVRTSSGVLCSVKKIVPEAVRQPDGQARSFAACRTLRTRPRVHTPRRCFAMPEIRVLVHVWTGRVAPQWWKSKPKLQHPSRPAPESGTCVRHRRLLKWRPGWTSPTDAQRQLERLCTWRGRSKIGRRRNTGTAPVSALAKAGGGYFVRTCTRLLKAGACPVSLAGNAREEEMELSMVQTSSHDRASYEYPLS